jgi:hypothetical protein
MGCLPLVAYLIDVGWNVYKRCMHIQEDMRLCVDLSTHAWELEGSLGDAAFEWTTRRNF